MSVHGTSKIARQAATLAAAALAPLALALAPAQAAVTVAPGYTLSVFAGPLAGSSAPDSIAVVGANVYVGYGNNGAPDGSGGATSTIAEYSSSGAFERAITVVGHNDGLRYDAAAGQLWAIQNEDGNPNLVLVNPHTLSTASPMSFSATPHGGGYDDVAFGAGDAFISASNPANSPNTGPAIVSATLGSGVVNVAPVLAGTASATVLNPGGGTVTLNLQDPDSLIFSPTGQLVLDSQSDQQLVFVSNPGQAGQSVGVLNLASTLDDTVFGSGGRRQLLFTDRDSGIVYSLMGSFGAGQAISAADTLNEIVRVDLSTGAFDPIVSGLDGPHGEAFTAGVPEPGVWTMLIAGVFGIGALLRRRRVLAY